MPRSDPSRLQVRGSTLWARTEWVRRHHGEDGLAKLTGAVSAAGRNLIREGVDRTSWYNFPLMIDLSVACDELFGDGDGRLNIEIGRFSAHANTPKLYSMFIRLGSVEWILGKAASLWDEHFNAGRLEVESFRRENRAECEIIEWPMPHLVHTYSVLGFAIGCVELSGEKHVHGQVVSCRWLGSETTRLRCRWGEDQSDAPGA